MTTERLWFRHTVEGLVRGLGARLTPELRARFAAAGVNLDRLLPGYSPEVMARLVTESAAALFPGRPPAEAEREVGRLFLVGYGRTVVGLAMLQFMRVIGPRTTLVRMQRNFRTGSNFIETRFTELGPRSAEVWFNDHSGVPNFFAGIIAEGASHTGAKSAQVDCVPHSDGSCTIKVDWEE